MKVKRMGIKDLLRKIWLIAANKINPSESICKQSSQVKLKVKVKLYSLKWQAIATKVLGLSFTRRYLTLEVPPYLYLYLTLSQPVRADYAHPIPGPTQPSFSRQDRRFLFFKIQAALYTGLPTKFWNP